METTNGFEEKQQEINGLWKKHKYFYRVTGGLLLISLGTLIGGQLFLEKTFDYRLSLCTNALAIAFGILVLDQRAQKREEERIKEDLIYRMGSRVNPEAIRATEELNRRGWLRDGSLENRIFQNANLEGAILEKARLRQANLTTANLQGATLNDADLYGAWLLGANLQCSAFHGANLEYAHLETAHLQKAFINYANLKFAHLSATSLHGTVFEGSNMQGTDLTFAQFDSNPMWNVNLEEANLSFAVLHKNAVNYGNLRGVNFHRTTLYGVWLNEADLKGAINLEHALFDEATTLPDGTTWTPDTDMTRFTNPKHTDFWRSDDPKSPAYRGAKNK